MHLIVERNLVKPFTLKIFVRYWLIIFLSILFTLVAMRSLSLSEVASLWTRVGTTPRDWRTGAPSGFLLSSISYNAIIYYFTKEENKNEYPHFLNIYENIKYSFRLWNCCTNCVAAGKKCKLILIWQYHIIIPLPHYIYFLSLCNVVLYDSCLSGNLILLEKFWIKKDCV